MCVKTEQLGLLLIGVGIGLFLSFALCGWFLRILIATILIVLGLFDFEIISETYPCPALRIYIPEHIQGVETMELAFEQKQQSCLRRTAHLSLAQEQTQELIIPDSMPDAAHTLICYAEPEVQSKTNREGSLLVTGGTARQLSVCRRDGRLAAADLRTAVYGQVRERRSA